MDLNGHPVKRPIAMYMLILFVFTACNRFKGEGDLLYTLHKDVKGPLIQTGDLVELTAIEKTETDSVIWNSADYDRTALVTRASSIFAGDLFAALGKLSKGDSATIKINMDSMPGRPRVKGKYLIYELCIHNVIHDGQEQFIKKRLQELRDREPAKIAAWIAARQLKTITQPSGLQYTIHAQGSGALAEPGDTVAIRYKVTLMSGKVIDTALQRPRSFIAGLQTTIAGLEEAMRLFTVGTKATVIIPSSLAFGEAGFEGIQSYTPLIYELEIEGIGRFTGKHPTEPGAAMPDFALTNIANDVVLQKEDLRKGKTVFVLFSSDCDHCRQLIAAMGKQSAAFKNVQLYFVSADGGEAIQQYGALFTGKEKVVFCRDDDRLFAARFQARSYPSVYIYNGQQKLLKYFAGEVSLPAIIKALR